MNIILQFFIKRKKKDFSRNGKLCASRCISFRNRTWIIRYKRIASCRCIYLSVTFLRGKERRPLLFASSNLLQETGFYIRLLLLLRLLTFALNISYRHGKRPWILRILRVSNETVLHSHNRSNDTLYPLFIICIKIWGTWAIESLRQMEDAQSASYQLRQTSV